MTAAEWIKGYQSNVVRMDELERKMREIRQKYDDTLYWAITPKELRDDPIQFSATSDVVLKSVEHMVDVLGEAHEILVHDWRKFNNENNEIRGIIYAAGLTAIEERYVTMRYLRGLPPQQISIKMGYTLDYLRKVKLKALDKISPFIPTQYRLDDVK